MFKNEARKWPSVQYKSKKPLPEIDIQFEIIK